MPKRINKSQHKVDSTDVQGEGSFVIIKAPTLEHVKSVQASGVDEGSVNFGIELLKSLVIDWNWVDDDDNPLPKPTDDANVIDRLPIQELTFLINALDMAGLAKKAKN